MTATQPSDAAPKQPQDWVKVLARYREPNHGRSALELGLSLIPFLALWALAWWALSVSVWISLALSLLNGGFLVRLFIIQHDCGHNAFFSSRRVNDWTGRILGVLTLDRKSVV